MEKKNIGFNIVNKRKGHQPNEYGLGSLSLENISPVVIDVEAMTAVVDIGALHARSTVEKGIKFTTDKAEVPEGKLFWLVWVTVDEGAKGSFYTGVTACEMLIDAEAKRGYKNLAEHVNRMDKSMKRQIIVEHMDEKSKTVLMEFLQGFDATMWANSDEKLHEVLQKK